MAHGESARCIRAGLRHGRLYAYAMPGKDIGPPFGSAEAVNGLRSPCGLARTAWTDPVLIAGVTPVKTVHLTERAGRVPTTGSRIRRFASPTDTAPRRHEPLGRNSEVRPCGTEPSEART